MTRFGGRSSARKSKAYKEGGKEREGNNESERIKDFQEQLITESKKSKREDSEEITLSRRKEKTVLRTDEGGWRR